jgi:hypothetical protein
VGAFISLAFGWHGSLEEYGLLEHALEQAGLHRRDVENEGEGEDIRTAAWALQIDHENLPVTSRSYPRDGWVATTLDIDEDRFEALGARYGRAPLVQQLVRLGETLMRLLNLRYLYLDEEAEAETDPSHFTPDVLMGITLVADGVPGIEQALQRPDIVRSERFDGGVTLFRREDPVPHYQTG